MKPSVRTVIVISLVVIAAVAAIVAVTSSGKDRDAKYEKALALMDDGKLTEAYTLFAELYGYRDSARYATELFEKTQLEEIKYVEQGDIFSFGRYEQNNNTADGEEEIEWLVLEKRGDSAFVVSRYALDCQMFDTPNGTGDWETSSIRRWLNRSFFLYSFNEVEQLFIEETFAENDGGKPYETSDRIFLLSVSEVKKYMKENPDRACEATAYAEAAGAHVKQAKVYDRYYHAVETPPTCHWWLRSPGESGNTAACVYADGQINEAGNAVSDDYRAVRPAMWIRFKTAEQ